MIGLLRLSLLLILGLATSVAFAWLGAVVPLGAQTPVALRAIPADVPVPEFAFGSTASSFHFPLPLQSILLRPYRDSDPLPPRDVVTVRKSLLCTEVRAIGPQSQTDLLPERAVFASGFPARSLVWEYDLQFEDRLRLQQWGDQSAAALATVGITVQTPAAATPTPRTRFPGIELPSTLGGLGIGLRLPVTPLWTGFAISAAFWAVVWAVVLRGPVRSVRRSVRRRRGLCPSCAYPLGGLAAPCPECGAA